MADRYGFGDNEPRPQEDPVELERLSAVPPTESTRDNPSYLVSADLFKTQRMHIGNFPQKESEITLSIVDVQTHTLISDEASTVIISGVHTLGAANVTLVGFNDSPSFVISNASFTGCDTEFLRVGDDSAVMLTIANVTLDSHIGVAVYDPNKSGSTLTNNYGIKIANIDSGTNNWAIHTGTGLVHFGDTVDMAGGLAITGALSGVTTIAMSGQLTNTLAIGTAPFVITSTTLVANLNADLLDGQEGAFYTAGSASPLTLAETDSPGELLLLRNDTGIVADEALGILSFQGDEGSDLTTVVKIEGFAAETWDGSNHAAYLAFSTMDTGDALAERMRITSEGRMLVGSALDSGNARDLVQVWRSDGAQLTVGREDATIAADFLGGIGFAGDEGSDFYLAAQIQAVGTQTWTATVKGTDLEFYTTPAGGVILTERMVLGQDGTLELGQLTASSDVQTSSVSKLITVSDERLKTERGRLGVVMPKLLQITPRYFTWNNEDGNPRAMKQLGFFAQDVHRFFPEAAPKSMIKDYDGEYRELYGFNSRAMLAVVVKGVQELNERLTVLEEVA